MPRAANFELWGALGSDGDSHLEHLRYIGEFLEELPLAKVGLVGDYNHDGKVDVADFVVWRDTMGSTTNMLANGDNTGASFAKIDAADYTAWRRNFGMASAGSGTVLPAAVPEPATWIILPWMFALGTFARERHGTRQGSLSCIRRTKESGAANGSWNPC